VRATLIHGPRDIRVEVVADPVVQQPGDAVVRVVAACVCGSDLWPYRGVTEISRPRRIGHEFVGVVEDVGSEVATVRVGDFVIAPFALSDNTCVHCRNGVHTSCANGAWWGGTDEHGGRIDAGQGEAVRVPMADGTLVATPEMPDDAMIPSLACARCWPPAGWARSASSRCRGTPTGRPSLRSSARPTSWRNEASRAWPG